MTFVEACEYIQSKLGFYYNAKKVNAQLKQFRTQGMSYDDICERVMYWWNCNYQLYRSCIPAMEEGAAKTRAEEEKLR